MFLLKIKKWVYSRFFVKALPEGLFKYTSKSRAFWRSVKAMAVLTRQGLYFDVWGFCVTAGIWSLFFKTGTDSQEYLCQPDTTSANLPISSKASSMLKL